MEIFTIRPFRTQTPREKETEIGAGDIIRFRVAAVAGDITAAFGVLFGGGGVFAVASGPFVVPDVEDCAGLRGGFGFEGCGVLLGAGGAAFAFDDFGFSHFLGRGAGGGGCCGEGGGGGGVPGVFEERGRVGGGGGGVGHGGRVGGGGGGGDV